MRRRALDYVCATCRHCAQSRTLLNRSSRRYVQISATPSSQEPQQSLDAKESGSSPSAGMFGFGDALNSHAGGQRLIRGRCALRSAGKYLLPPLCLHIALTEPLHTERDAVGIQWQARECKTRVEAYIGRAKLIHPQGCLDPLTPRTFPARILRNTLYLPTNDLDHALYSSDRHKVFYKFVGSRTFGRETGLDGSTAECFARVDRTKLKLDTEGEHEDGM